MRPELETYYQIDRYFRNELSGGELADFESRLITDVDFANEVNTQKAVNSVVIGACLQDLRLQMSRDLPQITHSEPFWRKWWIWAGVGILSIVAVFVGIKIYTEDSVISLPPNVEPINRAAGISSSEKNIDSIEGVLPPKPLGKSTEIKSTSVETTIPIKNEVTSLESTHEVLVTKEVAPSVVLPKEHMGEATVKNANEFDCKTVNIHLTPDISPSCIGGNSGKIAFVDAPKSIKISRGKSSEATSQPVFYHLAAGLHSFVIQDENGCHSEQQFTVPEKNCKPNTYVVNPEIGETWTFPVNAKDEFTVSIKSRSGQPIFSHDSRQSQSSEWFGNSQNGNQVDPGLYIYIIEFVDGRKESGQISIVK